MNKSQLKRNLYICIEIKSREYDSQILLAGYAAKRGYRVYLGTHAAIYALLRNKKKIDGILLDKSTQPRERMLWLRKKVEQYCILDAELSPVLIESVARKEFPTRIYEGTTELIDKYFVVGPAIATVAREFFEDHSHIVVVTGWPRVDVWSKFGRAIYADEAQRIRRIYGEFLLLVSSFGQIRHPEETKNLRTADVVRNAELNSSERKFEQYENFKRIISLIQMLDEDPDVPIIVVRPHPSEPIHIWRKELGNLKKTFVIQDGDVSPWVFASKGLIHNGSTTSIQAHFADKKVIMLSEFTSKSYVPVPEALSQYLLTGNSASIKSDFSGLDMNPQYNPAFLDSLVSMPPNGAIDKVLDELDDLRVTPSISAKRPLVVLSQVRFRSLKRGFGLARDEILWKFGMINITPQLHVVPGGLDRQRIRKVISKNESLAAVRFRKMSINLWELEQYEFD